MAEKIDIFRSYGEKLISLFVRLMFERKSYSLNEISRMLNCSKPTVLRLLNDIRKAYRVDLEEEKRGKEKLVSIKTPALNHPLAPLTEDQLYVLTMCKTFTEHLIGKKLFEEAAHALVKSRSLLRAGTPPIGSHFACFLPGTIDYTPYHEIIRTLIEAMESKRICRVTYKAIMETRAKSYYVCPLKLFSHVDTIYLHAKKARTPGERYSSPMFDPILPVHRFRAVELTERKFEAPSNYDFDKAFNRTFGVMKDASFKVEGEFTGWAARYVAERIWSQDQEIKYLGKHKVRLTFTATSEAEVLSWILSFGNDAILISPAHLVATITRILGHLYQHYKTGMRSVS